MSNLICDCSEVTVASCCFFWYIDFLPPHCFGACWFVVRRWSKWVVVQHRSPFAPSLCGVAGWCWQQTFGNAAKPAGMQRAGKWKQHENPVDLTVDQGKSVARGSQLACWWQLVVRRPRRTRRWDMSHSVRFRMSSVTLVGFENVWKACSECPLCRS